MPPLALVLASSALATPWAEHDIASGIRFPTSIRVGDLDADGDPDVLTTSAGDDEVAWYPTTGGASGAKQLLSTEAPAPQDVVAADLDGDGDLDLVVAAASGVVVFEALGGGVVAPARSVSPGLDRIDRVAVADLDGDGDLDLLAASEANDTVASIANLGGFGFGPVVTLATADGASSVAAADLDGDGDLEVVATAKTDDVVLVLEDTGAAYGPPVRVATGADDARDVQPGDVDRDGDLDLLVGAESFEGLFWLENQGGAFVRHPLGYEAGASGIWLGDVEGDGDLDVLASGRDYARPGVPVDLTLGFYENQGRGSFLLEVLDRTGHLPGSVAGADLDGDGDAEALATWPDLDLAFAQEKLPRTFGAPVPLVESCQGSWLLTGLSAGDVDGDGVEDVVVTCPYTDGLLWYQNLGGRFSGKHVIDGPGRTDPQLGDLDRDGDLDVVTGEGVAFHENLGGGTFAPRVDASALDEQPVALGDFDRDGDLDALATVPPGIYLGFEAYVYPWTGGSFGARRFVLDGFNNFTEGLAVDLDGDGDPEPMIGEYWDAEVDWAEANGVRFGPRVVTPTGVTQGALDAADLDGDGDLDVAVAGDRSVVWLENTGGALAAPRPVGATAALSFAVVATDVDLDGDPDLVVSSATVDLFENLGGGLFAPPVTLSQRSADELDVLDVDGDGDPDVAAHLGYQVVWLENPLAAVDVDGDGYSDVVDCVDTDGAVHPGAPEDCGNGVDDDCDGLVDCGGPETADTGLPGATTADTGLLAERHTGDPVAHTGDPSGTTTDGGTTDGGPTDGGPTDGGTTDAPETDAPETDDAAPGGGCGCTTPGAGPGPWAPGLVGLVVARRRRARRATGARADVR